MIAMIHIPFEVAEQLHNNTDIEVYMLDEDSGTESLVGPFDILKENYSYGIEGEIFGEPYEEDE